jgi:bla regulator protein BlaR1
MMAGLIELLGSVAPTLFDSLARASIQGGVFILLVWILCRAVPQLPAFARCILWWLASLKLLVAFVCVDPFPVPVLKAPPTTMASPQSNSFRDARTTQALSQPTAPAQVSEVAGALDWSSVSVGVWAGILALLLAAFAHRMWRINGMAQRAAEAPRGVRELAACLADGLALRQKPTIRFSDEVGTPLVLGFCRPVVLLPARRFAALSPEEQRMALCHELLHLRRKDLWLACVPALAERLFFFHPLAHLAVREYQLTREAACDAAVIRMLDAPPRDYGRLLLALGVSHLPVHLAAAGSPSSYSKLKRRITMLRHVSNQSTRLRIASAAAILLTAFAITPLTFVARSQDQPAEVARSTRPVSSATPIVAPVPTVAPAPAAQPSVRSAEQKENLNYVLFLDSGGTMMSGSSADVSRAKSFRKGNEKMLWFRRGGREYVVRDPAFLEQVQEVYKPLQEIGGKQAEIGAKQAAIGGRQAEIGKKQAAIGSKQAEIGARQARIGARQAEFAAQQAANEKAEKDELESKRRQLEFEVQDLDRELHELSGQMQELNSPMKELSKEMNSLSEEMNVLNRRMREASAKAEVEMSALLDRAISSRAATEVK